jgi:regulator of replication initiation timing
MASLLDLIKDLHIEHESAPILKERLGLIETKAAEFERKFNLLNTEVLVLRQKNTEQKADNARLVAENTDLKERLKAYEQPSHDNLPEEQKQILILLTKSTGNEEKIIPELDRGAEAVRFDLEELKEMGLVESQCTIGFMFWNLTQDGRRFLKKNGLLI